jgi:hypothetical protein
MWTATHRIFETAFRSGSTGEKTTFQKTVMNAGHAKSFAKFSADVVARRFGARGTWVAAELRRLDG